MLPVDIIVPVYRGMESTRRCVESVLACPCGTPFELVIVDDASPDPVLSVWLDQVAATGRITLHRNPENLGFVATVNRAMALHPERDAVLLNSDTEVAGDWLDRLAACVASDPVIGTVTPFTNNGSICSYPTPLVANDFPSGCSLAELDAIFARTNAGQTRDVPTGVGFCLYIRRACWLALDGFDAVHFGRGYGEECDFCMRAGKAGWRNVLCADVFVFHEGAVSFGAERKGLMDRGAAAMSKLHPDYHEKVMAFLREDPLRALRDNVTWAVGRYLLAECVVAVDELISKHDAASLREDLAVSCRRSKELADYALANAERFVHARESEAARLLPQCNDLTEQTAGFQGETVQLRTELETLRIRYAAVNNSGTWRDSRRLLRWLGRIR